MKNTNINPIQRSIAIMAALAILSSCKKELSSVSPTPTVETTTTSISASTPISVALNGFANTQSDSVYVMYTSDGELFRDEIPAITLPAAVQQYQTENYQQNDQLSAYTISDKDGNLKSYVSIIRYNERPVALEYNFVGTFKKVLEQREWADLDNDGWHIGGLFEDRDGNNRDVVNLNLLPDEIKNYMTNNYPDDIIVRAFQTKEEAIIVISKNNGGFANVFNKNLELQKHLSICDVNCQLEDIEKSTVSLKVLTTLSNTFPNYIFNYGDMMNVNGVSMGNLILLNANNTRYLVAFDANGNLLSNKVVF
jgi:hypothetical protein